MPGPRRARRLLTRAAALRAAAAVVAYAALGFLVLPPLARPFLAGKIAEATGRGAAIREIRLNPFTLAVTVRGFSLRERGGGDDFLSFEELRLDFQASSLARRAPVLREIVLVKPSVSLVRTGEGAWNFSDLVPAEPEPGARPLRFSLNNIRVEGGSIDLEDRPKAARHAVRDLRLGVPSLSNLPSAVRIFVQPAFSAVLNGRPVGIGGKTQPFSETLETAMRLELRDLDLPAYLPYLPFTPRFRLPAGALDADLTVGFLRSPGGASTLAVAGTVALKDLRVATPGGAPVLALPRLEAVLDTPDLLSGRVVLARLAVRSPELALALDRAGRPTLLDLLPQEQPSVAPQAPSPAAGAADAAPPRRFVVEVREAGLTDGTVRFEDGSREPPFRAVITGITVTAKGFTTERGTAFSLEAAARGDGGEALTHAGSVTLEPLAAEGDVALGALPLPRYAPYYGRHLPCVLAGGRLDLAGRYRFEAAGGAPRLEQLAARLAGLELRWPGEREPFLALPSLAVDGAAFDPAGRTADLGTVTMRGLLLRAARERGGALSLARFAAAPSAPPTAAGAPASPAPPWVATLGSLDAGDGRLLWEDRAPADPVRLEVALRSLRAERITTAPGGPAGSVRVALGIGAKGSVAVAGTLALDPFAARLDTELAGIDLVPLQPYATDRLRLLVTGGACSARGTLALAAGADGFRASYAGGADLAGFAAVDRATGEDLLRLGLLRLSGVDVALRPPRVGVGEVALRDFFARIVVDPDGGLNVARLVGEAPAAPPGEGAAAPAPASGPAPPPATPIPVRIDAVTLAGGTVGFLDRHVQPNYALTLTGVAGRIAGLTSTDATTGELSLAAKLDNLVPVEVAGRLNPFAGPLSADVAVGLKEMDLPPLTPYAGKYAGYAVEKGKLSLDLKYRIERRRLDAENRVFVDQLVFGEKVESPEATALPVRLAVALLKDRNGRITLDVPVTGSLDDPEFSVWRIVLKVVVNLLAKAATSPFALLGALFGGGEEPSSVAFPAGSATLDPAGEARVALLAKALVERPALSLEIAGGVDAAADREALQRTLLERKVRAEKVARLVREGREAPSVDAVALAPEEYPALLAAAHARAFPPPEPPKRRWWQRPAKAPPQPLVSVAGMEAALLAGIVVTDDDLRQLAQRRAQAARDHILRSAPVEPGRLFLVERPSGPGTPGGGPAARVDFVLK